MTPLPHKSIPVAALLALLALLCSSCGTPRAWFRPAEQALTESPTGFVAAQYELRDGKDRWGAVRVWSTGAERDDDLDRDAPTRMAIAFEVENVSDGDLELDPAQVELTDIETRDRRLATLKPAEAGPPTRVGPDSVVGVRFRFTFPDDIDPDDIDSFRVSWVVQSPKGKRFRHFTTFVPSYYRGYRRYVHRPYGYWYPPFVLGFGWGWHHHWH